MVLERSRSFGELGSILHAEKKHDALEAKNAELRAQLRMTKESASTSREKVMILSPRRPKAAFTESAHRLQNDSSHEARTPATPRLKPKLGLFTLTQALKRSKSEVSIEIDEISKAENEKRDAEIRSMRVDLRRVKFILLNQLDKKNANDDPSKSNMAEHHDINLACDHIKAANAKLRAELKRLNAESRAERKGMKKNEFLWKSCTSAVNGLDEVTVARMKVKAIRAELKKMVLKKRNGGEFLLIRRLLGSIRTAMRTNDDGASALSNVRVLWPVGVAAAIILGRLLKFYIND